MESLLKEWNGETVVINYDQLTGAWIFIAIYSTKRSKASGTSYSPPVKRKIKNFNLSLFQ